MGLVEQVRARQSAAALAEELRGDPVLSNEALQLVDQYIRESGSRAHWVAGMSFDRFMSAVTEAEHLTHATVQMDPEERRRRWAECARRAELSEHDFRDLAKWWHVRRDQGVGAHGD